MIKTQNKANKKKKKKNQNKENYLISIIQNQEL